MPNTNVHIWFSGATDKTGKKLMEELDVSGGTTKPTNKKVVVGWGTKVKKDVSLPSSVKVINHPNAIKANRNKLTALKLMQAANVPVKEFIEADAVLAALDAAGNAIQLPLVGRTCYHQGGDGFWTCMTRHQVQLALQQAQQLGKSQYFQNFMDIQDEFRLHIIDGELVYAQKKVQRDNPEEAFVNQVVDNVKNAAARGNTTVDEETLTLTARQMAKKQPKTANYTIRSNTRGWKFSSQKESNFGKGNLKAMLDAAKAALVALNLQFGAVDCCLDIDGNPWIIEVNTGPGLEGTSLERYKKALGDFIDRTLNPKKAAKKTTAKATKTDAVDATVPKDAKGSKKAELQQKARLFAEMVEAADENEAAALESVFGKMFG